MLPAAAPSRPAGTRLDRLAASSVIVWAIAAWLTRDYGIWVSIGMSAVLLAAAAIGVEGRVLAGRGSHRRGALVGFGAGLLMAWATALLYAPVTARFPALGADAALLYTAFSQPGYALTLLLLPLIVTAEEVVWRGTMHAVLERRLSPAGTVVFGTLLYAAVLVPTGSPTLVLTALGAGACWTALRAVTNSLAAAVVAHLVWDLLVLVVQVVRLN